MSADVLDAWIEGRNDTPARGGGDRRCLGAAPQQLQQRLKLFSLNDYLGLSTHPDVQRAASEAALSYGMGAWQW